MTTLHARFDRRVLLRSFTAATAITAFGGILRRSKAEDKNSPPSQPATTSDFRSRLRGAVLSIPTPFLKNQEIDFAGVQRMIDRAIPHSIRVFSLTAGNSQYDSLTKDEIYQLTSAMIEYVNGRGLTISATDSWDAEESIKYSKFSEKEGADAVQVMRPEGEDIEVVKFFKTVAAKTSLPIVLHGNFSYPLLEKLVEIDTVVALKEDVGLEYYIQVQRKFGDRLEIFEGGPGYAFLVAYPYGSRASLQLSEHSRLSSHNNSGTR